MKTTHLSRTAPTLIVLASLAACGGYPAEAVDPERSAVTCEGTGGSNGGATTTGGDMVDAATSGGGGQAQRDARAGTPFVPDPPYMAPAHQGNLIHVQNKCSFPLWIHAVGGGAVLSPDDLKLNTGDMKDYTVNDWPFAWVSAYVDGAQKTLIDRVELNLFPARLVSYKLAYIDGIGLPMDVQAIGQGADCKRVGCYATQSQIMTECPEGLLSGKRCLSAGNYCGDPANASKPFCHALDASIAKCVASVPGCQDAADATTANAYRCDKAFGDKAELCAALNRGTIDNPTSTDSASFYRNQPHNGYAAWIHDICPGLYAFPYDDARTTEDAFHACSNSTQLNITFCPAG